MPRFLVFVVSGWRLEGEGHTLSMSARIEKAVFHTRLEELLASDEACDRLYFGHEFCQRLLPGPEEVRCARARAAERGCAFTLVTPFATNAGLERIRSILAAEAASGTLAEMEVVVNDWGVLHMLRRDYPAAPPVLGRLLTKQKRGPRLLAIRARMPAAAIDHFQRSNVDVPHVRQFLERLAVRRVELDNLLQGMARHDGLPASLYYPYGYITTTRLCLMMHGDRADKDLRSIGVCRHECRRYEVILRHSDMPVPLRLKGNTQFFFNDRIPDDLAALNVDRLVHTPSIPV